MEISSEDINASNSRQKLACIFVAGSGSDIQPFVRSHQIFGDAITVKITAPEIILGQGVTPFGSLAPPFHRFGIVLFHTVTGIAAEAELVLGRGVILFGGLAPPARGLQVILRHIVAVEITKAELVLQCGVAIFSAGPDFIEHQAAGAGRLGGKRNDGRVQQQQSKRPQTRFHGGNLPAFNPFASTLAPACRAH